MYEPIAGRIVLHRMFGCRDEGLGIHDYEIGWERLVVLHEWLVVVICWVVRGLMILDRRRHGFPLEWGRVLEQMVMDGVMFAWGPCMLGMLYYYLHQVAYRGGLSISAGVTLLQIWAYENISVFWMVVDWELVDDMPYVYSYRGVLAQGPLGYVTCFCHQLDTLD